MSIPLPPVTVESDERAEILFFQALKRHLEEREAFLNEECGTDTQLRAEVDGLLRDHDKAGSFLSVDAPVSPELEAEFARLKPDEPGEKIGPYKLLQQIGEGGFGVVWMAEQEKPVRRRVALKIIKLGMDTKEVIARFEQERQALAMMDHPNIARVLDAGATPFGRPFFVMELVRGIKITEYCDQAHLPTAERLRLFIAVCHAVQHAHQKGIIHRDLKPSNVLVTLHDGVPVPKIIDFGVAKATQQQRLTDLTVFTQFEQMIGTPIYMSPEQAEMSGLDIDTRTDIYSLGVLLYELLTGRTPFDPEELMKQRLDEIRRVIREDEPQKPSTFVSTMAVQVRTTVAQHRQSDSAKLIGQIRGDLDWIVMKALEKDRTRRYETATGLARDIERHLESVPVHARPATAAYRFRRWVKRNRLAVGAGAAVLLALLAGLAGFIWQAVQTKAALSDLRESAPAFAAMSRALVAKEQFAEAITKLDVAIKLRPDVADYLLKKADLLQSQFRFAEAGPIYREALRLGRGEKRAEANAALCEKLAREAVTQPKLSRESLVELFSTMSKDHRSAAEMMRVGKLLGEENKLLLSYWLERLKDLPIPPELPLEQRLTVTKQGELALDLSNTELIDLSPLEGMPLTSLDLRRCDMVVEISPLRALPLKSLVLEGTEVTKLSPLAAMKTLRFLQLRSTKIEDLSPLIGLTVQELDLSRSRVSDLTPLRGLPLQTLNLEETRVSDLTPLLGMPLKTLNVSRTNCSDLGPLAGMPLEVLDCSGIPALDFSALAGSKLRTLSLQGTQIRNLSLLRGTPLRTLFLNLCLDAREFHVLREIETLEVLTLPPTSAMPEPEFASIGALRDHPSLRSIKVGAPTDAPSKDEFWEKFDGIARSRKVQAVAQALARKGKYAEAARLFGDLIRDGTGGAEENSFNLWFKMGALLLANGDTADYQAVCKEMMERFRRRAEGDQMGVRLCVMSPNSGVPISELRRLMPHLALIRKASPYFCWFVLINGVLEYRAGRFAEAIELLRQVETDRSPAALAAAAATLAMAHSRQGDFEAAKSHLGHACAIVKPHWPSGPETPFWPDLLVAHLLVQEAEQVVASPAGPANQRVAK